MTTEEIVEAIVHDLWEVGRLDQARGIARMHVDAAKALGRAEIIEELHHEVVVARQTRAPHVQLDVIDSVLLSKKNGEETTLL